MTIPDLIPVPDSALKCTIANREQYEKLYTHSINDPEDFWREHGQRISWIQPFSIVKNTSFESGNVNIRWFEDGTLNACFNCLDRHLPDSGDEIAYYWEGDMPGSQVAITYRELYVRVCRLANAMRELGIRKGDRVTIYLPMIIEAVVAILACARIGAVHSVVFAGFSPEALGNRILHTWGHKWGQCNFNLIYQVKVTLTPFMLTPFMPLEAIVQAK